MALNANALTTVDTLRDYLARSRTADMTGQLGGELLELLVNRVSSAIASHLGRLTLATPAYAFTANAGTDTLTTTTAHGLAVGDTVVIGAPLTGTLSTGLAAHTLYYVKAAATTTTLTLSLTSGGTVVDITAAGSGGYIAKATRYLMPGTGGGTIALYRTGDYPLIDIASLTLQTSSETISYRAAVTDIGWFGSDTDYTAGMVRLDGYVPGRDPHEILMYARCGFCAVEAQRSGLVARHHREALDALENAALQWAALLWQAPIPSAETVATEALSFTVRERDIPERVAGLLAPYKAARMGAA